MISHLSIAISQKPSCVKFSSAKVSPVNPSINIPATLAIEIKDCCKLAPPAIYYAIITDVHCTDDFIEVFN